jgi:hypothetical protein
LVAFGGFLIAFTAAHNLKVLVFGYQPIDMYYIVFPEKFDGGLSLSVLRKKQLFKKNGGEKVHILKKFKLFTFYTPSFIHDSCTIGLIATLGSLFFDIRPTFTECKEEEEKTCHPLHRH